MLAGLANYAKNFTSMIEFYGKSTMLDDRKRRQAELANWIDQSAERQATYGKTLATLDMLIQESQAHKARDLIVGYLRYTTMLPTATRLYRLAN
jgi:hypothetical protein